MPEALKEDCAVAARLTLEHPSLTRSLGFASHPLEWFAFVTWPALIGMINPAPVSTGVSVADSAAPQCSRAARKP